MCLAGHRHYTGESPVYPFLFHTQHLYLPTFGVLAAIGLMLGLACSERTARLAGVDPEALWDAGLFATLTAFVLSRLLLLVENFRSFLAFPLLLLAVPSLTATGLLLTVIATYLWLRVKRVPILAALDAWAPCGMLVWALLALGHFAEGSDPGLPTTLPLPFGVPMPGEPVELHPVAVYAALCALGLGAAAYRLLRTQTRAGETAGFTLAGAGVTQFLLSFLRQPGVKAVAGLDLIEWVAVGMMVAGGLLIAGTTASQPGTGDLRERPGEGDTTITVAPPR